MTTIRMNPVYEIEESEALPILKAIRSKLAECGYKSRKFTKSNNGFYSKNGKNFCRVWFNLHSGKALIKWRFYCDPSDPLHQLGIDYLVESTIVNFKHVVTNGNGQIGVLATD